MKEALLNQGICKWCGERVYFLDSEATSYFGTTVAVVGRRAHHIPRTTPQEVDVCEIQIGLRAA